MTLKFHDDLFACQRKKFVATDLVGKEIQRMRNRERERASR